MTYCFETDFCHRFVNFEIPEGLVSQFENQLLEEYLQQAYQQEKGALLYHKLQEVPTELLEKKAAMTPGEKLFKEVSSDEEMYWGDPGTRQKRPKSFTLCMICNPSKGGYDQAFASWKTSQRSERGKKIVYSSSSYSQAYGKAVEKDENQMPLVGKIVFLKATDIEQSEFEEGICKWAAHFHRRLAKYCLKKPRYSELRPMRFTLS